MEGLSGYLNAHTKHEESMHLQMTPMARLLQIRYPMCANDTKGTKIIENHPCN